MVYHELKKRYVYLWHVYDIYDTRIWQKAFKNLITFALVVELKIWVAFPTQTWNKLSFLVCWAMEINILSYFVRCMHFRSNSALWKQKFFKQKPKESTQLAMQYVILKYIHMNIYKYKIYSHVMNINWPLISYFRKCKPLAHPPGQGCLLFSKCFFSLWFG